MTYVPVPGIAALPGFAESLRLLIEREEYTLEDIGMMFNVSRERIRQLADKHGISARAYGPGGHRVAGPKAGFQREWDDANHCFRTVPQARVLNRLFEKELRRDIREEVRAGYRAHCLAALKACHDRLRRPVNAREWWRETAGRNATNTWVALAQALGHDPRRGGYAAAVRVDAAEVGVPLAGPGGYRRRVNEPPLHSPGRSNTRVEEEG